MASTRDTLTSSERATWLLLLLTSLLTSLPVGDAVVPLPRIWAFPAREAAVTPPPEEKPDMSSFLPVLDDNVDPGLRSGQGQSGSRSGSRSGSGSGSRDPGLMKLMCTPDCTSNVDVACLRVASQHKSRGGAHETRPCTVDLSWETPHFNVDCVELGEVGRVSSCASDRTSHDGGKAKECCRPKAQCTVDFEEITCWTWHPGFQSTE